MTITSEIRPVCSLQNRNICVRHAGTLFISRVIPSVFVFIYQFQNKCVRGLFMSFRFIVRETDPSARCFVRHKNWRSETKSNLENKGESVQQASKGNTIMWLVPFVLHLLFAFVPFYLTIMVLLIHVLLCLFSKFPSTNNICLPFTISFHFCDFTVD